MEDGAGRRGKEQNSLAKLISISVPPHVSRSFISIYNLPSLCELLAVMASALSSQILTVKPLSLNYTQLVSLFLVFLVFFALKRRYVTPIRDVPGPFFASFSDLWKLWQIPTGHLELATLALHKEHGMQLHSYLTASEHGRSSPLLTDLRPH